MRSTGPAEYVVEASFSFCFCRDLVDASRFGILAGLWYHSLMRKLVAGSVIGWMSVL